MSSSSNASKPGLRCSHCGREVSGTVHTRASYHVDYYSLHTGEVEPVTLQRPDEGLRLVTVLKLIRPSSLFTCVDCYQQPAIRSQRDLLFRPELAAESENGVA